MNGHILIVGGSSGIGLAVAQAFLSKGWRVTISGRTQPKLEAVAGSLNGVETLVMNALDDASVNDGIRCVPSLTDVIATVGDAGLGGAFMETGAATIVESFESKAGAQLNVLRASLDAVQKLRSFTFTTGVAAKKGVPGMAPLVAVNAAIEALVPVLAKELAPLRINAVSPGFVDTPYYDQLNEKERRAMVERMNSASPLGHIASAENVAHAFAAIVGNDAINGTVLTVDAGA